MMKELYLMYIKMTKLNSEQKMFKIIYYIFALAIAYTVALADAATENHKSNIVILATGGTIAGTSSSHTDTVRYTPAMVGVHHLIQRLPELNTIANIRSEQIFQIASEEMTNKHWLNLSKRVNILLKRKDVDGIVITHGTDTIEETAYFLNLTVKSTKPVVIVGAMRPLTAISADGPMNLYNGVILASSKNATGNGVLVMLNNEINAAREVSKINTSLLNTFSSSDGVLGYMHDNHAYFYRISTKPHTTNTEFDVSHLNELPQVDIVYGYANSNRIAVDAFVTEGYAKGIISAGVGQGNLSNNMKEGLIDARTKGVIIVRSSRVGQGIVTRNGTINDDALDFIVSDSLNPQKARILLMLALTKSNNTRKIQQIFDRY